MLYSLEGTQNLAKKLAKELSPPCLLLLYGEIGVGKTTFTSFFLKFLGVNERISSPTFNIFFSYKDKYNRNIYHFDLFRLDSLEEVLLLDLEEYLNDLNSYVIIEWAEKIEDFLKYYKTIKIFFNYYSSKQRMIKILS